ncbi:4Fe-4S dicluster domain-containing protein [Methanoplanus sp. FWC-SCC4]|uniref:4Fe-4S dicluster domain-containing protein n=1 Tax=Methanochimaera problematica TaxID=2609417 RepID=A0AA97FE57_9EURY|nr:4Fe-4S dicluster domain-containing protein [Methanoplanus sp. FWC-SCC4]WOF15801.1 4Fe-4S dicluster domain-containing protein [Methanoplanus sp. FWC-SCC4]
MGLFSITKTIFKTLARGPSTIRYPFEPAKKFEATRGQIEIRMEDCIFCGLCSRHCPSDCIEFSKNDRTWQINRFRCISCNSCVEACPKNCLSMTNQYHAPVTEGPAIDRFTAPPVAEEKFTE